MYPRRLSSIRIAMLPVIAAALAGCAEHAPPDPSQVPYQSDPPSYQADNQGLPPKVLSHPYPCWRCGWTWWQ